MVVASVFNYLLFFGRDIWRDAKQGHRRMQFQSRHSAGHRSEGRPRMAHAAASAGSPARRRRKTQFRYCSKCGGDCCYCPEHLHESRAREVGERLRSVEASASGFKRPSGWPIGSAIEQRFEQA